MDKNDAVVRTTVRRGRIISDIVDNRADVRWEDGKETNEYIYDLDYGEPTGLDRILEHDAAKMRNRR